MQPEAIAIADSVFYPERLVQLARSNIGRHRWAAGVAAQAVDAARPWLALTDDELWGLVFGHTLRRSWTVWSNGQCPDCLHAVPMYSWKIDAFQQPWKVRCPHCQALFPKNDFAAFYRSGLDARGVFDPALGDRALLFNLEHPDPADPLHRFGVDDGNGYAEGENRGDQRWWFVATYLIHGQWKQWVLGGIRSLAAAYTLTGERAYAHKALILLDRVADLYPTFDFKTEGVIYEGPALAGYVSTWHDACEETREMALAYDQVRAQLDHDAGLAAFLAAKAQQHQIENHKERAQDIRRNIEDRILRDAAANRWKIESNYPRTDIAILVIKTVLDWPGNRDEVRALLDTLLEKATAVDGVTGEKGLAGYASFTIQSVAMLLGMCARLEDGFLRATLRRRPRLHQMFRFHIDTWVQQKYYPQVGDTGSFAAPLEHYVGTDFSRNQWLDSPFAFNLGASTYTFLWQLYELTDDAAFAQVLLHESGDSAADLPFDLFDADPAAFQASVRAVIAREGATPQPHSVDKQQWHLALLRSGRGAGERVAWLSYDAGGRHSHANGMNLGLFAKGLDLMPDFGYPPVQYGGWGGQKFDWYLSSAAHNTVVVDGRNHSNGAGRTTLWADGESFRALRVAGPQLIEPPDSNGAPLRFERTIVMIDVSEHDGYLLDIFRVTGGREHARFMHSHFGSVTAQGLSLTPCEEFGHGAQMRNFRCDTAPQPGWSVDWRIEDRLRLLPSPSDIHLRYTDLTSAAQACLAEGWIAVGGFASTEEVWIPRLMIRRAADSQPTAPAPLQSTFVGVIEPYEGQSNIRAIRRLPAHTAGGATLSDADVVIEVELADGRRDLIVAPDAEPPHGQQSPRDLFVAADWALGVDAELCWLRRDPARPGRAQRLAACHARRISIGGSPVDLAGRAEFAELELSL